MSKKKNITGQKFERLTVIEEAGKNKNGCIRWKCKCDCGNEDIVTGSNLRNRNVQSCGCLRKEKQKKKVTKHGQSTSKGQSLVYTTWRNMLNRCYSPNNSEYSNYGERGIKVCRKWWKFKNFYKDMGDKPKGLTLERKDNDGNYKPSNCKWATQQEQAQNRRAKGCHWNKKAQKWQAYIEVNRKKIHLGLYKNEEDARKAYLEARKKYFRINSQNAKN